MDSYCIFTSNSIYETHAWQYQQLLLRTRTTLPQLSRRVSIVTRRANTGTVSARLLGARAQGRQTVRSSVYRELPRPLRRIYAISYKASLLNTSINKIKNEYKHRILLTFTSLRVIIFNNIHWVKCRPTAPQRYTTLNAVTCNNGKIKLLD